MKGYAVVSDGRAHSGDGIAIHASLHAPEPRDFNTREVLKQRLFGGDTATPAGPDREVVLLGPGIRKGTSNIDTFIMFDDARMGR